MRDIVIFHADSSSTMINAGLPLVQALDILAGSRRTRRCRRLVREVVFERRVGQTPSPTP